MNRSMKRRGLFLATIWLSCVGASRVSADDEALVAWYKMDEVTQSGGVRKIADASGNNRETMDSEHISYSEVVTVIVKPLGSIILLK